MRARPYLTFVVLAGLLVLARPAGGRELPIAVESDRVSVRAEVGLERQAQRLAAAAAGYLDDIEGDLIGLPRVDHVEVRLVKHAEDLAEVAPPGRGAPSWAAGTAYPKDGVVAIAARSREGDLYDMERTLAHELAHMALSRALGDDQVPRWLTEGFAYLHSSDFSWARAQTLLGAVVRGKIIPLGALDEAFPVREDAVHLAYAESYEFVAFLARRGRWQDDRDDGNRAAFQQFLAELAGGTSLDGAAREAFGRSLRELETEWLDSLKTRYFWLPIGIGASLLWIFGALLLVLGWLRRRRQGRLRIRQWDLEDALEESARLAERDRLN